MCRSGLEVSISRTSRRGRCVNRERAEELPELPNGSCLTVGVQTRRRCGWRGAQIHFNWIGHATVRILVENGHRRFALLKLLLIERQLQCLGIVKLDCGFR